MIKEAFRVTKSLIGAKLTAMKLSKYKMPSMKKPMHSSAEMSDRMSKFSKDTKSILKTKPKW